MVAIIGEISSASGLAIAQVAQRNRILFFNTGCNSDELRGKACNRYMFHTEAANTMYVYAAGQALLRDGMVKGKKWYSLTADYAFGHDLLKAAKRFMAANGGEFAADELVPTDAADFSAYLLKIRNAKPDLVVSNLAGAQITNFMKQYLEYGLPFPVGRIRLRHGGRVGRGQGQRDRHLAAGVGLAGQVGVGAEVHRRVHEEVRQAAGEPGVGRLHVDQARRAGDERDQDHGFDEDRRAPGEGRQVRRHEVARRLLPQLGSPADAGDVHDPASSRRARSRTSGTCSRCRRPCRLANQSLEMIAPTQEDNNCTMHAAVRLGSSGPRGRQRVSSFVRARAPWS